MRAEISYGKAEIGVYRVYAGKMAGVTPIPESAFTGRENILFALQVDVEVFGDNFLPAYTEGDNSNVVPTDTMKNFVLRQALDYRGATLEGFLCFVGEQFLSTYPQMHMLRLTGNERPFEGVQVPGSSGFERSGLLFSKSNNSHARGVLEVRRGEAGAELTSHTCGCVGLQLIKVTGSAFASFVKDEYTTLPERKDRPLFTYLDVYWKYKDPSHAVADNLALYIPAEQVRDLVQSVFHEFVSMSIQHLIYEIGNRLLARFPQMAQVSFEAQNRLWDTAFTSEEDERLKVYTDPRPPYGLIRLTLDRAER